MKTRISVRVQPRARRPGIAGVIGGAYKLMVGSPPVEGRANQECIEILAEALGVRKADVQLVHGAAGKQKIFEIAGVDEAYVKAKLGA